MRMSKKSLNILKEAIEVRYVNSQKEGWVPIVKGDRDWDSALTLKELQEYMKENWAKDHIKFMEMNVYKTEAI
tara:strand:- start:236 stop:454 length:219 start_codon:yes stop_codon:yes gene_type:complete